MDAQRSSSDNWAGSHAEMLQPAWRWGEPAGPALVGSSRHLTPAEEGLGQMDPTQIHPWWEKGWRALQEELLGQWHPSCPFPPYANHSSAALLWAESRTNLDLNFIKSNCDTGERKKAARKWLNPSGCQSPWLHESTEKWGADCGKGRENPCLPSPNCTPQ